MAKYLVKTFYETYTEKIVEANSEAEALIIADCIMTNPEHLMDNRDQFTSDVSYADSEDKLTDQSADDKRWIKDTLKHYRENNPEALKD